MRRLVLAAILLLGAAVQAAAVVDDRGVTIDLPRPPQRIVTLLPSLAETVCELGACGRLVGVDNYTNWPASVARLPRMGGVDDANIERIVALQPDLVLMGVSSRAMARLQGLGLRVAGFELKTMNDVHRVLRGVARILEVDGAEAVWRRMDESIAQAARSIPPQRRGETVYFEIGSDGYAASRSSHIGELLAQLGARNIVPGELGTVPKLNPEFVVRADPQVIMVVEHNVPSLQERPGWHLMRAVRDRRVCGLTAAENDVIMRPGPRIAEGAWVMARCLGGGK
jgi:iron complex transport system substrate-binding protein